MGFLLNKSIIADVEEEAEDFAESFGFAIGAQSQTVGNGIIIAVFVIKNQRFGSAAQNGFAFEKVIIFIVKSGGSQIGKSITFAGAVVAAGSKELHAVVRDAVGDLQQFLIFRRNGRKTTGGQQAADLADIFFAAGRKSDATRKFAELGDVISNHNRISPQNKEYKFFYISLKIRRRSAYQECGGY